MKYVYKCIGNIWSISEIKIERYLIVQERYLRTNYIEGNIEVNIDIKINLELKIQFFLHKSTDAACKSEVDSGLNDPSVNRTLHILTSMTKI